MNAYVIPLLDPQTTLETVGGKGLSLAKMIQAGFPVPNGFHITTESYRTFVDANNLQTKILAALRMVDAVVRDGVRHCHRCGRSAFARFDRGARVWHPGGVGHGRGDAPDHGWSIDHCGWRRGYRVVELRRSAVMGQGKKHATHHHRTTGLETPHAT